jgi:hypothetical protein
MVRLVQAFGVLLALGVAADYFNSRGQDRDYEFRVITEKNGKLGVEKPNHNPPYLLSEKKVTRFHFTNDTDPPIAIHVKLFESVSKPADCHVEFKPGMDCTSDVAEIASTKRDQIRVQVPSDKWGGEGCEKNRECKFNIQMKPKSASDFADVDPDLRIERDGRLRNVIRWLLLAASLLLLGAPIFRKYFAPSPPA